jgi:hypothetical protein
MAATALLVWAFGRAPNSPTASTAASAWTSVPAPVATDQPSQIATPLPNTSVPTELPTATIIPSPTATATPTVRPSPTTVAASPIALGQVLLSERFNDRRWAEQDGRGWSVGYHDGRYQITADPGVGTIWSYRTGPAGDVSYQVELQASGEGGLLLRFQDERNYLICTFDSVLGSYRISQQIDGVDAVLAEGQDPAIKRGAEATNLLETRLLGSQLQLFANGEPLTQITLKSMPDSPRYGFVAIAGDSTIEALFDNFEIRALEP